LRGESGEMTEQIGCNLGLSSHWEPVAPSPCSGTKPYARIDLAEIDRCREGLGKLQT
jgi:hypothetical protein